MRRQRTDSSGGGMAGWFGDRLLTVRDQLLTSTAFQRWAARTPLVRTIARSRARAAFDLCAGFVYSQALLAIVRLGLLEAVVAGPVTRDDLVGGLPLPGERADLLVDAAIALDILSARSGGQRIGLGALGAAMIANPGIMAMIEHHALVYADLADPVALLDGREVDTRLARFWHYEAAQNSTDMLDKTENYSALMTVSQGMLADDILDAYPLGRHRRILDIGGGEGAFLIAVGRRCPTLELSLLDLPPVAARAADRFRAAGLGARTRVVAASFLDGPLPTGHDVATLVRIVHDHDDAAARLLLQRARESLPP